jgi:PEP-CTERM motif
MLGSQLGKLPTHQITENSSMSLIRFASAIFLLLVLSATSRGDLFTGTISNFQDGTPQGWDGGTISVQANSGPGGAGDFSLQLSNGTFGNFAMFNTGVNGVIAPSVWAISADILRPAGTGSAEIRMVLFDTSANRWTSSVAANVIDDGLWHNYQFSVFEADLTRVLGGGTYTFLRNNLERLMFRYDAGAPSAGGSALNGTMNFDNITAIPEPTTTFALLAMGGLFGLSATRKRIRS